MENYIPDEFKSSVESLLDILESGDETRVAKAKNWFMRVIHERITSMKYNNAVTLIFEAKDREARLKAMTVCFQLHEYWTIDGVPDKEEKELETFEAWEARMGLGPATRDSKYPPFGYLGAIPLDAKVIRPTLQHVDDGVPPEPPTDGVMVEIVSEVQPPAADAPAAPQEQGDLFQTVEAPVPVLKPDLTEDEKTRLFSALGKGQGNLEVPAVFLGKRSTIKDCLTSTIPEEFLDKAVTCSN
jgi:hypothetical protein